jgi:hypothetical protein
MKETKEQFEERYKSFSPDIVFGRDMVAMPCSCEDGSELIHWAAIHNTPKHIQEHIDDEIIRMILRNDHT